MFLIKAYAAKNYGGEGVWRTINGSPVFIEGGRITKGPARLVGSTASDAEGSNKSASDRKEELKKKYGDKLKEKSGKSTEGSKSTTTKSTSTPASSSTSKTESKGGTKDVPASARKEELRQKYGDKLKEKAKGGSSTSSETSKTTKETKASSTPTTKSKDSGKSADKTADSPKKTTESKSTSPKNNTETFTVDGVKYEFKVNANGEGVITKDGGTTLVGFNTSFKSVKDAQDMVRRTNERVATAKRAETVAKQTGGVALYTGKVIQPGSVKRAGVDPETRQIQYTAVDHTGKTISLDSADMGAVLVQGLSNFSNGTTTKSTPSKTVATPKAQSTFNKAVSSTSTSSTTKASGSTGSVSIAGFTKSQNTKLNNYVKSGMSVEEAADKVLSSSGYGIFGGGRRGGFR